MIDEIREHIRARCNAQAPTFLELHEAKELLDYLDAEAVTAKVVVEPAAPVAEPAAGEPAVVAEPEPEPEPVVPAPEPEPEPELEKVVDLADMTKDELLEHADSVGAEVSKSDNKVEIVKAIKKAVKAKNK